MSTVTSPMADQQFVLYDLSWEAYESMLASLGDRYLRHTYIHHT